MVFVAVGYDADIKETEIVFSEDGIKISSLDKSFNYSDLEKINYRLGISEQGLYISTRTEEHFIPGVAKEDPRELMEKTDEINSRL